MMYILLNGYYTKMELVFQDNPIYFVKKRGKDSRILTYIWPFKKVNRFHY